jgi:hypothetical protein
MVIEAQSPIAELLAKDPVLLAKVVNDLQLALVHPTRKRRSAESGMGRKLFGVSKPIIATKELWWNRRRLIQIPVFGPYGIYRQVSSAFSGG